MKIKNIYQSNILFNHSIIKENYELLNDCLCLHCKMAARFPVVFHIANLFSALSTKPAAASTAAGTERVKS